MAEKVKNQQSNTAEESDSKGEIQSSLHGQTVEILEESKSKQHSESTRAQNASVRESNTTLATDKPSVSAEESVINIEGGLRDEDEEDGEEDDEEFELFDDFMRMKNSQDLYSMMADLTSKDSDWQTSNSPDAVAIRQQVAMAMQFQQYNSMMPDPQEDLDEDISTFESLTKEQKQKLSLEEIEYMQKRQILMATQAAMRQQEAQMAQMDYDSMKQMMDMDDPDFDPEMLHAMMMEQAAQQQMMQGRDSKNPKHPWMAKEEAEQMYNENQILMMQAKAEQRAQMMGQPPPVSFTRSQYQNPEGEAINQNLLLGQSGPRPTDPEHLTAIQKAVLAGEALPPGTNGVQTGSEAAAALEGMNVDANGMPLSFIGSWIEWFCSLEGHEFMCHVPKTFIQDKMNWIDLRKTLKLSKQRFTDCEMLVLAQKAPLPADLENQGFLSLNQDASDLYGFLHRRYINSTEGLAILYGRYLRREYGTCPRALCDSQGVLPVGMNDKLRVSRVKVFCPKCEELYVPQTNSARAAALDGSYFGTSLCHVFLKAYENLIVLPPVTYNYEPTIFGFKMAGKAGSKLWEPRTESIVNTKERETVLFEKISGKRNYQTASKESALLKPSFHGQKTVKVNVNKNNNNNTKQQKAVAQDQQQQQQRKHKKNKC